MNRSDIFDSFIKIAQKEGLISEAEGPEHTEFDFPETNPRHDSLSIEQIGKLYNNKPNMPEDMKYKNNIMEVAHPDPLVISPSYDKLNGLIENEIEGQNIRLHIVMKEPDGHLTQRKYAEKELILSLVRVANKLDGLNNEGLCKLADACLTQAAKKKITKSAQWQVYALRLAVPLLIGLFAKEHMNFHSDGFEQDCQKAESEINDLMSGDVTLGLIGHEYTTDFKTELEKLQNALQNIKNVVLGEVIPALNRASNTGVDPTNSEDFLQQLEAPQVQEAGQNVQKVITDMKAVMKTNWPVIFTMMRNLSNPEYQKRVTVSKGELNEMVEATEVESEWGLISNDFKDVVRALGTVRKDLQELNTSLNNCTTLARETVGGLQTEMQEMTGGGTTLSTPSAPNTGITAPKSTDYGLGSWVDKWTKKVQPKP